jgi:hypothetical protein
MVNVQAAVVTVKADRVISYLAAADDQLEAG